MHSERNVSVQSNGSASTTTTGKKKLRPGEVDREKEDVVYDSLVAEIEKEIDRALIS